MNMTEYIAEAEGKLLHTYNRFQIVLDKGEGMYLYDIEGKKYLDFCAGIAVFGLGYGNKVYNDALKNQIDSLIHTSNYFYNVPAIEAASGLLEASGLSRVFFTNSGAEAIEGAIKAARKYAYLKDGSTDHEIIAMEHSFHGRTMGALSVTGNPKYREAFEPGIGNIKFAKMNDLESVRKLLSPKTCAILLETVQGEGGIYPATEEFLRELRRICDEQDILLILDEIQCGMGRTGYMFAFQKYGIMPDIVTSAKGLTCGVPGGAFLLNERVAKNSLVAGDHGTTYGGNPLAAAATCAVLKEFKRLDILANVQKVGAYLGLKLDEMVAKYDTIVAHRGLGLMHGLEFKVPVGEIIKKCNEKGLILINAGANIIRFVPPLIVTTKEVDDMLEILKEALD